MQSGKAAAVKAVFRRDDLYNGQDYDRYALSRFATKNLAPIARGIGLDELQRVGRGTPAVSDEMCARALLALLGVLELTVSPISRDHVLLRREVVSSMVVDEQKGLTFDSGSLQGGNDVVLRAISDLGILQLPPIRQQIDIEEQGYRDPRQEPDTLPAHW